jgi:hypothetical protein
LTAIRSRTFDAAGRTVFVVKGDTVYEYAARIEERVVLNTEAVFGL